MLFDTHCHLDAPEFDADREEVLMSARRADVGGFVVPSVDVRSLETVRGCCRRYPGCFPAYGIHPLRVDAAGDHDIEALRAWFERESRSDNPPVAVGEIGLDFFFPGSDVARQECFFVEQLKLAEDLDLPVLLHVRRSVDRVLKFIRHSKVRRGIAHAFNGSFQQAEQFISLGFCLGFGGAMTFPGARRIRALAADLPLDTLVLETDAPYMSPAWLFEGASRQRNSPDQLPKIAAFLANLRGITPEEIISSTTRNARLCLRLTR